MAGVQLGRAEGFVGYCLEVYSRDIDSFRMFFGVGLMLNVTSAVAIARSIGIGTRDRGEATDEIRMVLVILMLNGCLTMLVAW